MGVSKGNWRQARKRYAPKTQEEVGLRYGFRSGLEETNAKILTDKGIPFEFEGLKIPYKVPETIRKYILDFYLKLNWMLIETKGKLEPKDRAKHILIKLQYPEFEIRFVFQRPHDKIIKGSKTTYAMWAEKHGFKWASRTIPEAWMFEERPPGRDPKEVVNGALG